MPRTSKKSITLYITTCSLLCCPLIKTGPDLLHTPQDRAKLLKHLSMCLYMALNHAFPPPVWSGQSNLPCAEQAVPREMSYWPQLPPWGHCSHSPQARDGSTWDAPCPWHHKGRGTEQLLGLQDSLVVVFIFTL